MAAANPGIHCAYCRECSEEPLFFAEIPSRAVKNKKLPLLIWYQHSWHLRDFEPFQQQSHHQTFSCLLPQYPYGHVSEKMKQDSANRMEAYMQHTICGKKLQNG